MDLVNVTCFKLLRNGVFTIMGTDFTTINLANPNSVDLASSITRLAQGAWAVAVAVCVVSVVSNSFRDVSIAAVGMASLVTMTALFFVTWNLVEILEHRPDSQS